MGRILIIITFSQQKKRNSGGATHSSKLEAVVSKSSVLDEGVELARAGTVQEHISECIVEQIVNVPVVEQHPALPVQTEQKTLGVLSEVSILISCQR